MIYYGFPLPNSFYAKLKTGIRAGELFAQGVYYLFNSLHLDPITLILITLGVAAAFLMRNPKVIFHALGILFYILYVIQAGGDFMSGRFSTSPFIFAVVLITRIPLRSMAIAMMTSIFIAVISLAGPYPPLLSDATYSNKNIDDKGIADERGFYYQYAGLLKASRNVKLPNLHREVAVEARAKGGVTIYALVGYFGYYAGPRVHVADPVGIVDPLLARLPAINSPNGGSVILSGSFQPDILNR